MPSIINTINVFAIIITLELQRSGSLYSLGRTRRNFVEKWHLRCPKYVISLPVWNFLTISEKEREIWKKNKGKWARRTEEETSRSWVCLIPYRLRRNHHCTGVPGSSLIWVQLSVWGIYHIWEPLRIWLICWRVIYLWSSATKQCLATSPWLHLGKDGRFEKGNSKAPKWILSV